MRITMNESRQAAPDGIHVVRLAAGETYDLPDDLARRYVDRGIAVAEKAEKAAPEDKSAGAAPANKTAGRSRRKTA